ncbi:MAG: iron-containing alcohol dehydrogenase [Oscillospiraceae bacterium]|jgi:alcohol dehydrogenase YqhD (iron-dependent ADH family)|nr:iron-containing alcohol dehydrogenase [Oscillospiraceae bacterium]
MQSFVFYSPTEVVFGKGAEEKTGEEIRRFGGNRVFVVYGGGSVVKSGLLDKITGQLKAQGIPFETLGGVQPNPHLDFAEAGVEKAADFGADFILAVGGGSVIDTAKAIAHGVANPGVKLWDIWCGKQALAKSLPVGVVLTISAAGSETSDSAVLTNTAIGQKRGLSTDFNRPRFAVMNPELTYTLPDYQVGCGIVDIMMHTLDRYFTNTVGNDFTDEAAEALLRTVIRHGRKAVEDKTDYEAMSELMWCGSVSHNGLTGLGAVTDFAPHQLGHELSAMFDAAHGASLSTMWGSWALHCWQVNPGRFVRYARQVWGISEADEEKAALAGIQATVDYFKAIHMPTCFSELGIGLQEEAVLRELAERCSYYGARLVGHFKELNQEDLYAIYRAANR